MNISLQTGSVYTDLGGLDQLKYRLKGNSIGDLRLVAQQFEALFIQQMLKTMREAKLSEGAFDSQESNLYVEMLDKQLSLNLSQGAGIGLADILVRQLSRALKFKNTQVDRQEALTHSTNTKSVSNLQKNGYITDPAETAKNINLKV